MTRPNRTRVNERKKHSRAQIIPFSKSIFVTSRTQGKIERLKGGPIREEFGFNIGAKSLCTFQTCFHLTSKCASLQLSLDKKNRLSSSSSHRGSVLIVLLPQFFLATVREQRPIERGDRKVVILRAHNDVLALFVLSELINTLSRSRLWGEVGSVGGSTPSFASLMCVCVCLNISFFLSFWTHAKKTTEKKGQIRDWRDQQRKGRHNSGMTAHEVTRG